MTAHGPGALAGGFLGAALLSGIGTWAVLGYARSRLLDEPNPRSSHCTVTPRGGGVALALGSLVTAALLAPGLGWPDLLLLLGLAGMAALGFCEDHAHLRAGSRLLLQACLVVPVLAALPPPQTLSLGPFTIGLPVVPALLLALLGCLWLVNLTNFMDGIDGIAGVQGLVACGYGFLVLSGTPRALPALLALTGAGACLGFLAWNWPPARIFMGDVGSTFLGLLFAILVLAEMRGGVSLEVALLPLLPFVADSTFTLARRALRRERLTSAHRSHLYQRLARAWGAHRPVTLLYGGLGLAGALGAELSRRGLLAEGTALLLWLGAYALLVAYGRRRMLA